MVNLYHDLYDWALELCCMVLCYIAFPWYCRV